MRVDRAEATVSAARSGPGGDPTPDRRPLHRPLADGAERDRIGGLDVARALAIAGMVQVHWVLYLTGVPSPGGWPGALLAACDGRATAIFITLAGIGITLFAQRHDRVEVRRHLRRRAVVLLLLGFANVAVFSGDILRVYGVAILIATAALPLSDRRLLALAASFPLLFVVLVLTVDFEANWDWATLTYHGLWTPRGALRNLFYDGFRSVVPWTGVLLFGMWLGRQDLAAPRLFRAALAAAVMTELLSAQIVDQLLTRGPAADAETIVALFGTSSVPAMPVFLVAAVSTAVAVITACVHICRRVDLAALRHTGQLALTWYVAHIVAGLGAVDLTGTAGEVSAPAAVAWALGGWSFAVACSYGWRKSHRRGPLEAVMRRLVSGR